METSNNREIRVFISSTFRDMMRERDLLVKEVFPELRRKCAKRFVTFTEVDLRWGITEAQANEGQVLPLCLAEIERSRPYFIGLLGERYGWVPETILPEVLEREPWLIEHVQGRTSVTELEILHGVLNNPKMQSHAFFYFRDPVYVSAPALTDDERWDMVEHNIHADVEKYGEDEAARRTQERKDKLAALKQRIRDKKLPLVDTYADPKALAEIVHQQFGELIDRLYPEDKTSDLLVQERMSHEAHAKNKLFACIDRPDHLKALNKFAALVEHNGKGIVVTGESGGGKTALLAAWARDWAAVHLDDFLLQHYFGATPDSASPEGFLRRVMGEIKREFNLTDDVPTDLEKLRDALPLWLAQTIGKGSIILVLDGLNQVQGTEPDRRLNFLPRHFPQHVTVLASALPGPALDALRERRWTEHDLPRASDDEVDAIVGQYLSIHARTLEPKLRQQLVTAPGAKNPLFLRTVLEELRQFGSFERLPERVRHYLEADSPCDLFLRVLIRWQEDFDGKDPKDDKPKFDLVRRALTHLWAARQGLSESEWLDLLGDGSQPLPRKLWSPLFFAMEPHLSQREGFFAFGHDFLRQAVEAAFVSSSDLQQTAHLSVADYFERHAHQREMTPRKTAEWPFQLHAAQAWDRLETCLTDIPLFLALCQERTRWELTGYWHPLRERGRDMGVCYNSAYGQWIAVLANVGQHTVPAQLGVFLLANGLYAAAEPFLQLGLGISEMAFGPEQPDTLISLINAAALLSSKGDYAGSEPLYRRALEVSEQSLGPEHPITLASVSGLANVLFGRGAHAAAEPMFRRALEGRERVLGAEHPDTLASLNNLAELLSRTGDCQSAEPLHRRALEISERVLGLEHPSTLGFLNNLAELLRRKGDLVGAEPFYRRSLECNERVLGPDHPNTLVSANNLGFLFEIKGDDSSAEPLYVRTLEARDRVLGSSHPNTLNSLNNLAELLARQGDYAGAETLHRRALETRERVLGAEHPDTQQSLNNLGVVLGRRGNWSAAEPLFRRAVEGLLRISSVIGRRHPNLESYLSNYGGCLERLGFSQHRIMSDLEDAVRSFQMSFGVTRNVDLERTRVADKLGGVVEEMIRDPSKVPKIYAKLVQEDPVLLRELLDWSTQQRAMGFKRLEGIVARAVLAHQRGVKIGCWSIGISFLMTIIWICWRLFW